MDQDSIPWEDLELELEDDLLDEIDKAHGFELSPDPWLNPTPKPTPKPPKCECGLGTDAPSSRHYTWCCCYIKEETGE